MELRDVTITPGTARARHADPRTQFVRDSVTVRGIRVSPRECTELLGPLLRRLLVFAKEVVLQDCPGLDVPCIVRSTHTRRVVVDGVVRKSPHAMVD